MSEIIRQVEAAIDQGAHHGEYAERVVSLQFLRRVLAALRVPTIAVTDEMVDAALTEYVGEPPFEDYFGEEGVGPHRLNMRAALETALSTTSPDNRVEQNTLVAAKAEHDEYHVVYYEDCVWCRSDNVDNLRKRISDLEAVTIAADDARPKIVTLCGSTRFHDAFQEANFRLTMAGYIVLSVGFYPHTKSAHEYLEHGEHVGITENEKERLDDLHKRKIDLSDEVFVLNVGGYIGDSTRSEIAHAEKRGIPVRYLEAALATPSPTKENK